MGSYMWVKNCKSLKILGKTVKIKRMSREKIAKVVGFSAHGCYDPIKSTIYIETESKEDLKFQTITMYHEICHAIMSVAGLDQVILPDLQEIICETFSNALVEIENQKSKPLRKTSKPSHLSECPSPPSEN
jgi:hypothetical protein